MHFEQYQNILFGAMSVWCERKKIMQYIMIQTSAYSKETISFQLMEFFFHSYLLFASPFRSWNLFERTSLARNKTCTAFVSFHFFFSLFFIQGFWMPIAICSRSIWFKTDWVLLSHRNSANFRIWTTRFSSFLLSFHSVCFQIGYRIERKSNAFNVKRVLVFYTIWFVT